MAVYFSSCENETTDEAIFEYHAHIMSPDTEDKHLDDTIHIHVEFESHTGETVHNVNVRIFNVENGTEVYNEPAESLVLGVTGEYAWHDSFVLSIANGFEAHSNWTLEAKVWGEETGEEEVVESVDFHVHP